MNIFLSAEIYGRAYHYWFVLQKEFKEKLNSLTDVDYGSELDDIGIISIILSESFFEDGGYPERVYLSHKNHSADIRLRINYKAFISGTDDQRRQMYKDHIIECIERLRPRLSRDYKIDMLIDDIKRALDS